MNWTVLGSKMLSAAAYDNSKQILYLRFRNTGDVLSLLRVPGSRLSDLPWGRIEGPIFPALTSAITSVTSAWPSSEPPD